MPRRIVALVGGILVVVASMATPVAAADPQRFTASPLTPVEKIDAPKSRSGAIAQSDPALLARTDSAPVKILVKLDVDATATYDGRIDGLAATSPTITGKHLAQNGKAVSAYERYLHSVTDKASAAIRSAVPQAAIEEALTTAYGGVAVTVPANRAKDLLKVPGVVAVQSDKLEQLDRAPSGGGQGGTTTGGSSVDFIGAPQAWRSLGGSKTAGQGVVVGILDTGVWPEHPMLQDPGIPNPGGTYDCQFGDGTDPALGPAFTCNDKLVGAYAFLDTYLSVFPALPGEFCDNDTATCSARDADGHGTHTTTTAAGSPVASAKIMGIERGPVSGIAPGASVVAFRVCLEQGCFQSDSIEAVEKAIDLGIDVINFSIGGGTNAYSDAVELAFLDAYAAGISVNASAGNAGPGAATAEHAGPWVTTVGASTYDHMYLTKLKLSAAGGATFTATGSSIVPGISAATPVILATDAGTDAICTGPFTPGSVTGKIVVCSRGLPAGRNTAAYNVMNAGGVGMILYNPTLQSLFTDNFWVPTVMLEGPQPASDLLAFLGSHTGITATWDTGTQTPVRGDVMTAFSSRGPLGSFVKPDVTAPGIQILAGTTPEPNPAAIPTGPAGELYMAIAGTSMSSPHSTGVSALVKAAHPDWTPGQIKSALMTSSAQDVLKETGAPSDPWDRGAGAIRADRAIAPTVTFDVPASAYYASADDLLGRVDLNLASINADPMPGTITTTRTLTNVSGRTQWFHVGTTAPRGASIAVSPSRFTLAAGQSQTIRVTISAPKIADGWYFGEIDIRALRGNARDASLPVAFHKTQGTVTLSHTCESTQLSRGETTDCLVTATNLAPVEAAVSLRASARSRLAISDVSAPATPTQTGWSWTGTLKAAVAPTVEFDHRRRGRQPGRWLSAAQPVRDRPRDLRGRDDRELQRPGVPVRDRDVRADRRRLEWLRRHRRWHRRRQRVLLAPDVPRSGPPEQRPGAVLDRPGPVEGWRDPGRRADRRRDELDRHRLGSGPGLQRHPGDRRGEQLPDLDPGGRHRGGLVLLRRHGGLALADQRRGREP